MSSPLGQYGSKGYESSESRTLGKFAADKFAYREQAKNIIQLNNAVGYMSGMMRKMQRGIDEANQNFVQQIQGLINDFLVLLGGPGGGGDTGFEFGDLKYVLMAIGALFGFGNEEGEITLPINLFNAAWYFFSSYILPVQNFYDAINMIVDSIIAGVLDIFGEVPIVGQALEQLAVIISDIRDLLLPVAESLETLLSAFGVDIGDTAGITNIFAPLAPIFDALKVGLDGLSLPDFSAILHTIVAWGLPFVELIAEVINIINPILNAVIDLGGGVTEIVANLLVPIVNVIAPILNLINPVITTLYPLLDLIVDLVNELTPILSAITNVVSNLDPIVDLIIEVVNLLHPILDLIVEVVNGIAPILDPVIEVTEGLAPIVQEIVDIVNGVLHFIGLLNINATARSAPLTTADFGKILEDLYSILGLPLLGSGNIDVMQWATDFITNILGPTGLLAQAVEAILNIPDFVPISHIGLGNPNLLENPSYDDAESIDGGTDWFWSATQFHAPAVGSTYTTLTQARPPLYSKPTIKVAQDQVLHLSHWLSWTGLTGTLSGASFVLGIATYFNKNVVSQIPVANITGPAASSGWVQLAGDYTIPGGVDEARMYLQVNRAGATGGTVYWSDASFTKTQLLKMDWVSGLLGAFQTAANNLQSLADLIAGKVGALSDDITNRLKNITTDGLGKFNATQLINVAPIAAIPTNLLTVANVPDLGSVTDQITNALIGAGSQHIGTTPPQARLSMDRIYQDVMNLTQKMQDIRSGETAQNVSGTAVSVNFQNYPNGNMPSDWTVTYRGAGTSTIGVTDGKAGWRNRVNNGNRDAFIVYNAVASKTDFQIIRGTLANAPAAGGSGGVPKIWSMGRVDNPANPRNYVWARGYCTGFLAYKGDIGCTVNGVDTVWVSAIPLTWSMDIAILVGANANPRRYQVFSGTQLVVDHTEVGTASMIGAGYRWWGALSEIRTDSGGAIAVADVAGTSMSDNAPPVSVGSTFRAWRASTGLVSVNSGISVLPNNFFDREERRTDDMTFSPTLNQLTVTIEGTYLISLGYKINAMPGTSRLDTAIGLNGSLARLGGGVGNYSQAPDGVFSSCLMYLKAGDTLIPGTQASESMSNALTGESTGSGSFFEVCLVNRSLA